MFSKIIKNSLLFMIVILSISFEYTLLAADKKIQYTDQIVNIEYAEKYKANGDNLNLTKTTRPWVDCRAYSSINAAVAASRGKTVVVFDAQILESNLIIPSNVTLWVPKGGSIIKKSTYTLKINGNLIAGPYQIFSGFADGDVTFGMGSIEEAYPEWWGAPVNGNGDDAPYILNAINAANYIVFSPGKMYTIKSKVALVNKSYRTFIAYGATIKGDASLTDFMFEATGTKLKSSTNIRWKGGYILLNGSKGFWLLRSVTLCKIEEFYIKTNFATSDSKGIHVVNSFNVIINDFNIHGAKNSSMPLQEGIRIETDSGEGWSVVNNISIKHGIIQRCEKNLSFAFASASSGIYLNDLAWLDGDIPSGNYGLYWEGVCDNVAIDNCKAENLPYGIYINNKSNRYNLTINNFRFTNVAEMLNFVGNKGTITINNSNFISTSNNPYYLFNKQDAEVTILDDIYVINNAKTIDIAGNMSGVGKVRFLKQRVSDKINDTTIDLSQENVLWSNQGATGRIIFTLPPAIFSGFRAAFIVKTAQELVISPNGTDQIIGLTDVEGDRISSNNMGNSVVLVSGENNKWYALSMYGTWIDNN